MNDLQLAQCYELLDLKPGATVEAIDTAYSKKVMEKIRLGDKAEKDRLKIAYEMLKDFTQLQAYQNAQQISESKTIQHRITDLLNKTLNTQDTQIRLRETELQVLVQAKAPKAEMIAKIHRSLKEFLAPEIKTVVIYGMRGNQAIVWKKQFPMPTSGLTQDDVNPYSFNNRFINLAAFPIAFLFALVTNIGSFKLLFLSTHIWIHECGHATVAWLAGHQATPLPFGWTNVGEERSLFVYFGILVLFSLLFWTGLRERKRWVMGLAIALTLLQFYCTWIMPIDTYEMWLSFGGIGGEFYLSTLLMISFYFPLPEKWRWDFWRYPVLLLTANTFWASFWQWHQIKTGEGSIPWGSLFGGEGDAGGDMNQLSLTYDWSDQQIIGAYTLLGNGCLLILIGIYLWVLSKYGRSIITSVR
ncbi:hypothetical protein ACKFKF_11355 [Phormidesmis sp. 146-12]